MSAAAKAGASFPLPSRDVPSVRAPVVAGFVRASALWNAERRLEGEAYLLGGYGLRLQLESCLGAFQRVGALAHVWQPARLKGVVVTAEKGVPFLTTNQVFDIRPVVRKWLAASRVDELERRYLKPGWILITCSGNGVMNNVGKVFASYSAHKGIVVSHDLLRVEPRDPAMFGWIYAFLRSRFGRAMLRSSTTVLRNLAQQLEACDGRA